MTMFAAQPVANPKGNTNYILIPSMGMEFVDDGMLGKRRVYNPRTMFHPVETIRCVRAALKIGLKEAKDLVHSCEPFHFRVGETEECMINARQVQSCGYHFYPLPENDKKDVQEAQEDVESLLERAAIALVKNHNHAAAREVLFVVESVKDKSN